MLKRYAIQWIVQNNPIFTSDKRYTKKEAIKLVEKANSGFRGANHWVVVVRNVKGKEVFQRLDEIIT